jgi:metal-responsive CopG/Arc/MetJ family transcriptional regulator
MEHTMPGRSLKTTTVRLPEALYKQARSVVDETNTSLNEYIVAALKAYLKAYERRQIDAAFAGMATDSDYLKEAQLITEEFENSDWETLQISDKDLEQTEK